MEASGNPGWFGDNSLCPTALLAIQQAALLTAALVTRGLGVRVALKVATPWPFSREGCRRGVNHVEPLPVSVNLNSPQGSCTVSLGLCCVCHSLGVGWGGWGTSGRWGKILPRISSENYLKSQWWEWKNAFLAF